MIAGEKEDQESCREDVGEQEKSKVDFNVGWENGSQALSRDGQIFSRDQSLSSDAIPMRVAFATRRLHHSVTLVMCRQLHSFDQTAMTALGEKKLLSKAFELPLFHKFRNIS